MLLQWLELRNTFDFANTTVSKDIDDADRARCKWSPKRTILSSRSHLDVIA